VADEGSRSTLTGVEERVWTFLVLGDQPFRLALPNNPILDHHGGPKRTDWRLVGTRALMEASKEHIQEQGATVTVYMQDESPEQLRIREDRLRGTGTQ
jgi:hypothetical protein